MSAWVKKKIGQLGRVVTGSTPPTKDAANYGDGYLFVTPSDLNYDSYYVTRTERSVTTIAHERLKTRFVPKDAIMFTCIASIGKLGLAPSEVLTNQQINSIVPNEENDARFLYYLLRLRAEYIARHKSGVAVPIINKEAFEQIELEVPPLATQRRIAAILSDYDSAIANCRRQIALLEEAAQRLYREWFAEGKGEKWSTKTIDDLCVDIGSGGTPKRNKPEYWENGDVPWVKTAELQDCWLFDTDEKISKLGLSESAAKLFPAETIMMAIYASPTLGRLGIMGKPMSCNQATLCLIADDKQISWPWLYCKLYELRDHFNAIARGAGQQNISGIVVKNQKVAVPPKELIDKFTDYAKPMFEQQKELSRQIRALTEARDRLLPKLMSGEVSA